MSERDLREAIDDQGGVASTAEVADLLDVNEQTARRWARKHRLPRVGASFAFTTDRAEEFADELDDTADDDVVVDFDDDDT